MTDEDDPFADLEETVGEGPTDNEEKDQQNSTTIDADSPETSSTEPESDHSPIEEQAFSFEETKQGAFYARGATWDEFDVLMTEIEYKAKQLGAKNVSKSEIHDAILRSLDAEDIVEAVVEERRR